MVTLDTITSPHSHWHPCGRDMGEWCMGIDAPWRMRRGARGGG